MNDEWDQMCGGSWEDEHAAKERELERLIATAPARPATTPRTTPPPPAAVPEPADVEKVARVLYAEATADRSGALAWDDIGQRRQDLYRRLATAALDAMERGPELPEHMRGDGPCMDCGTFDTPVWFTDNVLWNRVVGGPGGLLCPICFIRRAESVLAPTGWRLTPGWVCEAAR